MYMKLVEITLDYPYNGGETFCKQELEIAEKYFDEILLISMSGHIGEGNIRYVPPNAKLINARKARYEVSVYLKSFFQLLRIRTIREIVFAKKKLRTKESMPQILKEIFIYYYYANLLKRVFEKEVIEDDDILYSYWMAAPAYYLSIKGKKALKVSRTHRFDCFIEECYQPFRREIIEGLDCIISISEAGKKSIEARLIPFTSCLSEKIKVSRLGIMKKSSATDFGGKSNKYFTILTCSNIHIVKRLDLMIKALEKINIPVNWIHIGDGELGEQIRTQAKVLDSNKYVKYTFKGVLTQQQIYDFYERNHIDLFVNCSDSEGVPVSVMEAISFGIPVIARDVGGNSEIVSSENGILLDKNITPKVLMEAIRSILLLDDDKYINLRKNAVRKYRECFMASENYSNFFEMLISMAKEK